MADRRPVRYQGPVPEPRPDGSLPETPVHDPHALAFMQTTAAQDELWERIPAPVRRRVEARYGQLLAWWVDDDPNGRVAAVVLGNQALVTAEPTVNSSGRPAYRVAGLPLDPSSFRSVEVTGPTGEPGSAGSPAPGPPAGQARRGGPGTTPPTRSRIGPDLVGLLGCLPARAQRLLQEPFHTGTDPLDWRYYYLSHGGAGGLSTGRLDVWCYLTDLHTVTFCTGTGYGYRDHHGAPRWRLRCWRASRPG